MKNSLFKFRTLLSYSFLISSALIPNDALASDGFGAGGPMPSSVEELFFCTDGSAEYDLYLGPDGALQLSDRATGLVAYGTYELTDSALTLRVPEYEFEETSVSLDTGLSLIISFSTPTVACHAVGHTLGTMVEAYADCPSIRWIPTISYQDNAFQFYANGMVKRRRWTELVAANDTLYAEIYGIYLIDGANLYMAFGDVEEDRYLTATIESVTSLLINELEPERGPCVIE